MTRRPLLTFGPFHLDPNTASLWRGTQHLPLRRRAGAVLQYLLEHAGECIPSATLLQNLWPEAHVSRIVLKVCIREIRLALGDTKAAPLYIETVGRKGYRFCGEVAWATPATVSPVSAPYTPPVLGRPQVVAHLMMWWHQAVRGRRYCGMISGEAGMGKSTLLAVFLEQLAQENGVCIAQGHGVEAYGHGVPYLPLIEALGHLGQTTRHDDVVAVLRQHAPAWAVQIPGLLTADEQARVQLQVHGASQARLLRELVDALDILAAQHPIVLVLEDLHWSDPSTLQALAALMQRQTPVQLLVLGTYRPAELGGPGHPLWGLLQEWRTRGVSEEVAVPPLSTDEVAAYIASRLGGTVPAMLPALLHQRTEGHPLFVTRLVEHLRQEEVVIRQNGQWTVQADSAKIFMSLPPGLQPLIVRQIACLGSTAQRLLEAASVVGEHFTVAAVAAGLEDDVETVEAWCETIVHTSHLLEADSLTSWPDGTWSSSYRFRHALYRQALYESLGAGRRMWLHRRIGLRLEAAYGAQASTLAAELVVHFLHGRDAGRTVVYICAAAERALVRSAFQETLTYCTQGVDLLPAVPDATERAQRELTLLKFMRRVIVATKGYLASELEPLLNRSRSLCQHEQGIGRLQQLGVLEEMVTFYSMRADMRTAHDLATQCLGLAYQQGDTALRVEALFELGKMSYLRGAFAEARQYLESGLCLCEAQSACQQPIIIHLFIQPVCCRTHLAWVLWQLGYAGQAQQRMHEALLLAQAAGHAFSLAHAHYMAAVLSFFVGDLERAEEQVEALLSLATRQHFPFWLVLGRFLQGKALIPRGQAEMGCTIMQQALAAYKTIADQGQPSYLTVLAQEYIQIGRLDEALILLNEARMTAEKTGEDFYKAEMARLCGEAILRRTPDQQTQAETQFLEAIATARQQQAKAWELRATYSLSQLWAQQGKYHAARQVLAEVCSGFTEGFDTIDLSKARQWLSALAEQPT